ncbi:MAG TPA: hypothetical protein VFT39_22950 [Vicinamibacterales bacterium]|nr:hypothetical protein [Vicinamibacterales bacterium]
MKRHVFALATALLAGPSDDGVKSAPPANGRWDQGHRRILFVDGGDIVLVDSTSCELFEDNLRTSHNGKATS